MKKILYYILIVGCCTGLMWFIIDRGQYLTPQQGIANGSYVSHYRAEARPPVSGESVIQQFTQHIQNPISLLLLQIITILVFSRFFGVLFSKLGQPLVIGEIIAGIFLGPSILGVLFPDFFVFLFPKESLKSLQYLSQIGLTFFMFIIGMELDVTKIRKRTRDAIVVSHASIMIPYLLGIMLAYCIYAEYAPASVSFLSFSLFLGISMSITAFPVLARIIQERKLTRTTLGALAITCAAADDVTGWCILAAVIAIVRAGNILSALSTIGLVSIFILFMLNIVRPWLTKMSARHVNGDNLSKHVVALSFFILLLSAYIAEVIGIHLLFGAFIAGVVMPRNIGFKKALKAKVEDISVLILLPIFFAFTGLRTQIGLLSEGHLWTLCGIIILVAVVGKLAGSALTARFLNHSWRDSLSLGILMNTRGLMELIVLNIGYDIGILTPEIFAIMVLMALATTFMTGPLLNLVESIFPHKTKLQLERA